MTFTNLLSRLMGKKEETHKPEHVAPRVDTPSYLGKRDFDALRGKMIKLKDGSGEVYSGKLVPTAFPTIDGYDLVCRCPDGTYTAICSVHPDEFEGKKTDIFGRAYHFFTPTRLVENSDNTYSLAGTVGLAYGIKVDQNLINEFNQYELDLGSAA